MQTANQYTDSLFDDLSSVYSKDQGMVNSNLYVILNAFAESMKNVKDNIDQYRDNTYIATADPDYLEPNFGDLIDFPKPPILNTLTNGDDIYRAVLKALYRNYLNPSTTFSVKDSLQILLSYLITDPTSLDYIRQRNYAFLTSTDDRLVLPYNAVKVSGNKIIGIADASDIQIISVTDLSTIPVLGYNDSTLTVSFQPNYVFSGTVASGSQFSGTQFEVVYYSNDTTMRGTNWINATIDGQQNYLPTNLPAYSSVLDSISIQNILTSKQVNTFDNPNFSYWWNTYNINGSGVVLNENYLTNSDVGLVWRLPEKTIYITNPYTGESEKRSIPFNNIQGQVYDINTVSEINPDTMILSSPYVYVTDVSSSFDDYFVRYSNNNKYAPSDKILQQVNFRLDQFQKNNKSISFPSADFGEIDFFMKGTNFDKNDLFGYGTQYVWLNVPNTNGNYVLSNNNIYQRSYSCHERILFLENFESQVRGSGWEPINNFSSNASGSYIADVIGSPLNHAENCLMLVSLSSGSKSSAVANVTGNTIVSGNRVEISMFDGLVSGSNSYMEIQRSGKTDFYNIRFGIDYDYSAKLLTNVGSNLYSVNVFGTRNSEYNFSETYFSSQNDISGNFFVFDQFDNQTSITLGSGNINYVYSNNYASGNSATDPIHLTPKGISLSKTDYVLAQVEFPATTSEISITFESHDSEIVTGPNSKDVYVKRNRFVLGNFNNPPSPDCYVKTSTIKYSIAFDQVVSTSTTSTSSSFVLDPTAANPLSLNNASSIHKIEIEPFQTHIDGVLVANPISFFNPLTIGHFDTSSAKFIYGHVSGLSVEFEGQNSKLYHLLVCNKTAKQSYDQDSLLIVSSGSYATTVRSSYYIQEINSLGEFPKNYLQDLPREYGWHKVTYDFGNNSDLVNFTFDEHNILNKSITPMGLTVSGILLNHSTNYPSGEFAYFDNVKVSYYNTNQFLQEYDIIQNIKEDWGGSSLNQSTVIDNKVFEKEGNPNFQFTVTVLGWSEEIVFMVKKLVEKVKPAFTFVRVIFEQDQSLDTSSLPVPSGTPYYSNSASNWETGNVMDNIIVKNSGATVQYPLTVDLPGHITPSGIS
jgi:hypothetical protein